MIEVVKIEDFVIEQLFRPYMPSFETFEFFNHGIMYRDATSRQKIIEHNLKRKPELIIQMVEKIPELKERVMKRLKRCGGVKWYRYLDMSNPVIRWVNENVEENGR